MTDAPSNARPIHSQGLLLGAVTVGILVLAVYLTSTIIDSENGGISAAVKTIGACLAIWAFVRPKAGLYIISVEAFSVDYIKKVAVYYGVTSMGTIIEVLIVTMLAVIAVIAGVLVQSVALRRYKIAPLNWAILLGSGVLAIAILFASKATVGFEKGAENAFNAAVYIALALPMAVYMTDREELNKLLKVQFWFAVVWSIWGIKQYYTGFTQMEWYYAETGLSAVATDHMLKFAEPRPFGFGSGVPNYGVISPYFIYGVWYLLQHRRRRLLYTLGTITIFWGLVTSLQRSALLFPFFVPLFYYCFRNKQRTITIYAVASALFVLGVFSADYLYNHVDDINNFISVKGGWGESVLTVNTFTARLDSWRLLTEPSTYTLFGKGEDIASHDVFSKILISYGVVGLMIVLAGSAVLAWFLHRTLLRIEDPEDRKFATFLMAATMPYFGLGFAGGGNFTTNPTNLQMWTFFGAAVSLALNSKLVVLTPKVSLANIREMLARQQAAKPFLPDDGPRVARP